MQRFLTGEPTSEGPFELPGAAEITSAVGGFTCTAVPVATAASCQETAADILNIAATAEALGITLYYQGIQSSFFGQLSQPRQWYLQAALDEERNHLNFLESLYSPDRDLLGRDHHSRRRGREPSGPSPDSRCGRRFPAGRRPHQHRPEPG